MYYILYALVLGLAYPLCIRKPTNDKKMIYLFVAFGFMFFLSAARYNIGNDYYAYIEMYHKAQNAQTFSELRAAGAGPEFCFLALLKLISFTHANANVMYALMAVALLLPVAWFIYKYSPNVWLSTWLYITLTFFYGTMNFVRQNLALAILLLGYPLLRKRKLWAALAYAGVVVAAALFHKTALVMLLVLLVCYLPLNKWLAATYAGLAAALYLTSTYILEFIMNYIYTNYQNSIFLQGLEWYFVLVPAVMLGIVLCFKKPLEKKFADAPLLVNMMLYGFLIWLFITKHMVLERFSLYIYIYVILIVPMAAECLKPDPALLAEREGLRAQVRELKGKKSQSTQFKALNSRYLELGDSIRTGQVFYWCLIAGVLIVTFIYNVFGMYDEGMTSQGRMGFHGVFPYQSLIGWIDRLP